MKPPTLFKNKNNEREDKTTKNKTTTNVIFHVDFRTAYLLQWI